MGTTAYQFGICADHRHQIRPETHRSREHANRVKRGSDEEISQGDVNRGRSLDHVLEAIAILD